MNFKSNILSLLIILLCPLVRAQELWPKKISSTDGLTFTIYQPQPESLEGNLIKGRTAVAITSKQQADPVFGALFFTAIMETNRQNRMAVLKKLTIHELKVPGYADTARLATIRKKIENEAPAWELNTTLDDIAATAEMQQGLQESFENTPPKIIYNSGPSVLVFIDGQPSIQQDDKMKLNRVINTVFLILQSGKDKKYYLQAGSKWFASAEVLAGWKLTDKLPSDIAQLAKELAAKEEAGSTAVVSEKTTIVVATEPTELIQSEGEPNLKNIPQTNLLYVANTDNDIFIDTRTNTYYVLLSGRWYAGPSLNGPWSYVASDKLPADFARIPPGSDKDAVLASVAGTDAAHDAVVDAQIPQTAKVDRKEATCTVTYDGEPKFEPISGTQLQLAVNSSATVIKSGNAYYCVDNAVWFKSASPKGPWAVSDSRPEDVDKIPPGSAAYNVKYVYIYETTPQYVFVGYTPGYMGAYVYGPVVVYGTGYYYKPWYVHVYYPRPVTYGFSVHYNPFTGWSIGFHYSVGFFHFHAYYGHRYGIWGPPVYRPPYYPRYRGGIYGGRPPVIIGGDVNINIDRSNNIYAGRRGVSNSDIKRPGSKPGNSGPGNGGKPSQLPANNNMIADKSGNVFRKEPSKGWQQFDQNKWSPAGNARVADLENQQKTRERATTQNNNFNSASKYSKAPAEKKAIRN